MRFKTLLLTACLIMAVPAAQAQQGGSQRKAAQKTTQKATQKKSDKKTSKTPNAPKGKSGAVDPLPMPLAGQGPSVALLIALAPMPPSMEELLAHKEAELDNKKEVLALSPVGAYLSQMQMLEAEARTMWPEATTVTIDKSTIRLKTEPNEEAAPYLKPLNSLIDQWNFTNERVNQFYADATRQCEDMYANMDEQLSKAGEEEAHDLWMKYYAEALTALREAAEQARQVRQMEQLPLAEQIEQQLENARLERPDLSPELPNYPQLTALLLFGEAGRVLELPHNKH